MKGARKVDFFTALEWCNWKNLPSEVKKQVFQQVLMYYVSPLKEISQVRLVDYEYFGLKCETFELLIDEEAFVFIPGNKEAILGWNLGVQGLPKTSWDSELEEPLASQVAELLKNYQLETVADWDIFVNEATSPLRKAKIPPMLVQKYPSPPGAVYLGLFNTVTGEFTGKLEAFSPLEKKVKAYFKTAASLEESLTKSLPAVFMEENCYYGELHTLSGNYLLYTHEDCTQESLCKKLTAQGYDLLTEDQWEYMTGAGTRRLFRWGNTLLPHTEFNSVKSCKAEPNMFGIEFSGSLSRWEITSSHFLKMEQWQPSGHILLDNLPCSSYYRSKKMLRPKEILSSEKFLHRKSIRIEPDEE